MEQVIIDYPEAFEELSSYLKDKPSSAKIQNGGYFLSSGQETFFIPMDNRLWPAGYTPKINSFIKEIKDRASLTSLIYGKDTTSNIVSCESKDGVTELFIESNGKVTSKLIPQRYYILSSFEYGGKGWNRLSGNLHYRYIKYFDSEEDFYKTKKMLYGKDIFCINDPKESSMILNGFTYYKGMKVQDVSILSFDIESMGLTQDRNSAVLLISNTFRSQGKITKRMFSLDQYSSEKDMLESWCDWVRSVNPSIVAGHNIFGYDLPYIEFCAKKCGAALSLGRDESELWFNKYTSRFRKDGSQDYNYNRAFIYGREIVDTMFVAYHFDFARKYESYGLKPIIKHEGLEKPGRQFYDAANIAKDWSDPAKRELIKKYAEDDADDALALFDLMIPAYFYLNQSIPKSFQSINYSASGSQINSLLLRSYLQEGHSIPKASDAVKYPGAISDGYPGIYKNVFKVDVASLYPSIMLEYKVCDRKKDPNENFLKMVEFFTKERLENKKRAKDTGERYYKEMEQAQKIIINSAYGALGAGGLHFNSPSNAAFVTEQGRNILKKAILWASGSEYVEKNEELDISEEEEVSEG